MRKLFAVIVYTIIVLLIGRNLPSLPRFYVLESPREYPEKLKQETENIIKKASGNYGVFFADLTTRQTFGIGDKEMFTAASVNKVHIVSALYFLENKGKIDLDEKVTLQAEDIQDYGTGSLRYQEPGGSYSLKTLAKLALNESDNTAAFVLAKRIGIPQIQKIIEGFGLRQTDIENNKTSPHDLYTLFTRIYEGKITSKAKSEELLGFMTDTAIEDRLPSQLPNDVVVQHKTGDAVGSLHDVGLIKKDGKLFFLAVMTSDIGDQEKQTKNTIASIAKNMWEFYTKRE